MKLFAHKTLDDILFEDRNKEYGSYRLRKQYFKGLAIGFIISVISIVILSLSYFWYLNSGGDESVYYFPSSGTKSVGGSLMDPKELEAYLNNPAPPKKDQANAQDNQKTDALLNFTVGENTTTDIFIPSEEETDSLIDGEDFGLSNDSTVFGGYFLGDGNGEGGGFGKDVDRFPEFPWGNATRYVETNLKYPAQAIKQNINGVVVISFMISKTGEVVNVVVERSVNPIIDNEAVKTIQGMPRWRPAMRHGRPVNFRYMMRVNFMPLT